MEACCTWSEHIHRLARGKLDHNKSYMSVCVCICFTHMNPGRPRCVWSAEIFRHFLFFGFLHAASFFPHLNPHLTDQREIYARDLQLPLFYTLLCALHSYSPPMQFAPSIHSLFIQPPRSHQPSTEPSCHSISEAQIPLALHLVAIKSHYLYKGLQKVALTPMEKALTLYAFCPQAWQVGVS